MKHLGLIAAWAAMSAATLIGTPIVPVGAAGGSAVSVTSGAYHSCALLSTGTVKCWGLNNRKQLGNPSAPPYVKQPVVVNGLSGVTAIAAGDSHTCALLKAGIVKCWGANDVGELGRGPLVDSKTPLVVGGLSGISAIAAGGDHACALLNAGTVKCWGRNYAGVLGNGTTTNSTNPVGVKGLTGVASISTGVQHSCALLTSGTVKCWGYNGDAELGTGRNKGPEICRAGEFNVACSTKPVIANGLKGVAATANGSNSTCARSKQGSVKCWGANASGALGNGTTVDSPRPSSVSGLENAIGVVSGGRYGGYACAVLAVGTVRCWGNNGEGELGNGTTVSALKPVGVSGITSATGIGPGGVHACARLAAGTVKCWGENAYGQLGNGTEVNSLKPVSARVLGQAQIRRPGRLR